MWNYVGVVFRFADGKLWIYSMLLKRTVGTRSYNFGFNIYINFSQHELPASFCGFRVVGMLIFFDLKRRPTRWWFWKTM